MATDHCGPSLAALVGLEKIDDNKCVWYNLKKVKNMRERCSRNVHKEEVAFRVKSVKRLRSLIAYDSDIAKWIYTDFVAVHTKLEEISRWMLCQGAKHRDNSTRIYERWAEELGGPTPTELEGDRSHLALADRPTADQIRQVLGIDHIEGLPCLSRAFRCGNPTSSRNKARAADIVGHIARAWSLTQDMEHSLLDLAELLLCRKSHQAQAMTIQADWIRRMKKLLVPKETTGHPPSTPYRHRTAAAESETPESISSSSGSPSASNGTITPATSPSTDRIGRTNISGAASPLSAKHMKEAAAEDTLANTIKKEAETQESNRFLRHNRVTRSTVRERNEGYSSPGPPSFKIYSPMTMKKCMARLKDKLESDITVSEKKDGYIYGYHRPSSRSHIKIGVSANVERRMKEWSGQCKYQPEVIFKLKVPHAMKVERLIQRCLHQERKFEEAGACNSGEGCGAKHIEWFEIAVNHLEDVAAAWQRWIEKKPYDERGSLKPEWRTHFKNVTLNGLPDSWRQWIDFTPVKVELTSEIKLNIGLKYDFVFDIEDRKNLAIDLNVKTEVVFTETEIKVEPEEDDAVRRRDLGAISSQYQQRLQRLQKTVKAEEDKINNATLVTAVA